MAIDTEAGFDPECVGPGVTECEDQGHFPSFEGTPCKTSDCIFGNNPGQHPSDGCVLTTDPDSSRCSGETAAPPVYWPQIRPWWRLRFGTDADGVRYRDFEGTEGEFLGRETYRYIVRPDIQLEVCPCAPQSYCPRPSPADAIWLFRILLQGRHDDHYGNACGWSMQCNYVDPPAGDGWEQHYRRIIEFGLDPTVYFGHIFMRLTAGDATPYCFEGANPFCFTDSGECGTYYDCLEDESGGRTHALDRLIVVCKPSYSMNNDVFPQSNPWDVKLQNTAWYGLYRYGTKDGLLDQLDQRAEGNFSYNSSAVHNAIDKNSWVHSETFDENNPGLAEMGVEAYPPVLGVGGKDSLLYPEYANKPIPLTCRSTIRQGTVDAELTYYQLAVVVQLHVERLLGHEHGYRVFADADVFLRLRPRLLPYHREGVQRRRVRKHKPNAWMLQNMLNPDDPYDLRLKDPDNPALEHPRERLVVYGPYGERVPRRMRWVGLRSTRKYSQGVPYGDNSAFFDFTPSGYGGGKTCCDELHAIHGTFIHGAMTNCSEATVTEASPENPDGEDIEVEEKEHWYQGYMYLKVPDISNAQVCG